MFKWLRELFVGPEKTSQTEETKPNESLPPLPPAPPVPEVQEPTVVSSKPKQTRAKKSTPPPQPRRGRPKKNV